MYNIHRLGWGILKSISVHMPGGVAMLELRLCH